MSVALRTASAQLKNAVAVMRTVIRNAEGTQLGEGLIEVRESIDQLESIFADGLHGFDSTGEYRAAGALSSVAWLKWKCRLSGGAAAERLGIARQLEQLPKTQDAFAKGEVGYQHVAALARTAENVGSAPVRQHEATLLQAAQTMDPGRFAGIIKDFEQRVDAASVLGQANRAYARRYLHLSEAVNGLLRLDGLLDAEGGAIVRTALNAVTSRAKEDERTAGQRTHDALIDLCKRVLDGGMLPERGGQRPHLIVSTSIDGLAGLPANRPVRCWARRACRPRPFGGRPATPPSPASLDGASSMPRSAPPAGRSHQPFAAR
jgi:hypothetical protein